MMKILKKVILSIVLFILGGCACDSGKETLYRESYQNKSRGKHFEHDISLNRKKHLKIETYIPYPGKNAKKNSLLAEEYLDESDGRYTNNDFRHNQHSEIETYIPFPTWFRRKRLFFTEEYVDVEYLEEPDSGYSNYDRNYIQDQEQPYVYQPATPSKHQKPRAYVPTSNKHQKPQARVPTPNKHQKPQADTSTPSKHQKPQTHISIPNKRQKPQTRILKPNKHKKP